MQTETSPLTTIELPALPVARTLWLASEDQVWQIGAGSVDVFAAQVRDGAPQGPLRHLFRAAAGQALFGIGPAAAAQGIGLLARPSAGARLEPIAFERLRALARHPEGAAQAAAWIDAWVAGVAGALAPELAPKGSLPLAAGVAASLADGASAYAAEGVLWLVGSAGRVRLLDAPERAPIGRSVPFPLAGQLWLRAVGECRLEPIDTARCLASEPIWAGLEAFHSTAAEIIGARLARQGQAEQARLGAAAANDRQSVGAALVRLAAILGGEPDTAAPAAGDTPLLVACRRVGDALGLDIRAPQRAAGAAAQRDPVGTIARASRVRSRRVALRGAWWRQENGPLLAFVEADRRPVALLPQPGRRYLYHDPAAGTSVPLTPELAAALDPFAYTFFRSFPDRAISAWDVARFGLRGSARDLLMVLLTGLGLGFLGLAVPIVTGVVFDSIIPAANQFKLLQLTLALVMAALASAAFQLVRGIAVLRIESRMNTATQAAVWDRLLNLPVPFFRQYSAGDLAARVAGIDAIRQTLTGVTVAALLTGLFSLFNFGLLFAYDARLGLVAFGLVLLAAGVTFGAGVVSLRYTRALTQIQAKIAGLVLQLISGIARLRVAGAEGRAFAVWAGQFAEQRRIAYRTRLIASGLAVFNAAFPTLALIVLFAMIASGGQGPRSTGTVLAFVAAFSGLLGAALSVSSSALEVLRVVPLFDNARPIFETVPEVDPDKADPGVLTGAIELSHVSFRYRADGPATLQDVSIEARPGEFVAIVGPSGSGKSTLMRLLLGFEAPEAGSIYYDGQDLATLDPQALRSQIGVVLQSGKLTPGDIFTNIVGSSLLSLDDAWQAAELAGLADDIRQMPMGMQTVISEGGSTFSGGQRQRLMIARAIVGRPRILLFDEATSALDNRTQAIVSKSLERLQATRIVIAHRLSTIMNADRIYVVEAGRVVQQGGYAELAAVAGPFRELIQRQLV
ncbi:NHLP bacteriocin export ABC transporter permease/ATPase subunit [Kouleothrix sp.]|uniref:NHLP bacteriocin export ABC transporter permease/ATPase subunit n=1 Tax=Kouleothrix sp. TaxID=2779161 RepID=UPI00391C3B89